MARPRSPYPGHRTANRSSWHDLLQCSSYSGLRWCCPQAILARRVSGEPKTDPPGYTKPGSLRKISPCCWARVSRPDRGPIEGLHVLVGCYASTNSFEAGAYAQRGRPPVDRMAATLRVPGTCAEQQMPSLHQWNRDEPYVRATPTFRRPSLALPETRSRFTMPMATTRVPSDPRGLGWGPGSPPGRESSRRCYKYPRADVVCGDQLGQNAQAE